MVYVLSHTGKALMPTNRHGKVKHLLREGRARVVRREPFAIQQLYDKNCRGPNPPNISWSSTTCLSRVPPGT